MNTKRRSDDDEDDASELHDPKRYKSSALQILMPHLEIYLEGVRHSHRLRLGALLDEVDLYRCNEARQIRQMQADERTDEVHRKDWVRAVQARAASGWCGDQQYFSDVKQDAYFLQALLIVVCMTYQTDLSDEIRFAPVPEWWRMVESDCRVCLDSQPREIAFGTRIRRWSSKPVPMCASHHEGRAAKSRGAWIYFSESNLASVVHAVALDAYAGLLVAQHGDLYDEDAHGDRRGASVILHLLMAKCAIDPDLDIVGTYNLNDLE